MKESWKKLTALALALLLLFSAVACSSGEAAPAEDTDTASDAGTSGDTGSAEDTGEYVPNDGETVRVGLVQNNRSEPFHVNMYNGLVAACEAEGWELEAAICDGDALKHQQADESFITRQVDVIVDFACLPESGAKEATSAKEAGIPLITVDVDYGEDAYFFGVNNQEAGNRLAEAALPFIQEKFESLDWVVLLTSAAVSPTMKVREDSVYEPIAEAYGGIDEDHVIRLDARTDNVRAASLTRDWLTAHPEDSNILFIATNDDRGYAAVSQIQALERTADCAVVSFNGDPAALEDLQKQADDPNYESPWVASIAFNPSYYGASIVAYAKEIFAGTAEKTFNAEVTPLTVDTIYDYLESIGEA